jgi:tetratricopeptide (TPR) repeat protein
VFFRFVVAIPLGLLILITTSSTALAEDRAVARQHYLEGTKAFDLGLYDQAVTEYMAAYQAKSDPALLYNIAQAHRLGGHLKDAVRFYKVYLQRLPAAPNRPEVEKKITELKQAIEQQDSAQTKLQPDNPMAPRLEGKEAPPSDGDASASRTEAAAPPANAATDSRPGRPKRIAGIAVAAVGLGAVATGIAFGVLAKQAGDNLSQASHAGGIYDPAQYSNGKNDQIIEGVMLGVGIAAVAGGVTLYWLGRRDARRAQLVASVQP